VLFVRFGEPGTSACLSRLKTNNILPTVQNTIQAILVMTSTSHKLVVSLTTVHYETKKTNSFKIDELQIDYQARLRIMNSQAKVC